MRWHRPHTLFGRTAAMLFTVSALFQVVMLGFVLYYILMPMSERSADDLAALMLEARTIWEAGSEARRANLTNDLSKVHGLVVVPETEVGPGEPSYLPYSVFLAKHLGQRTGKSIPVTTSVRAGTRWYHAHVPIKYGRYLRFSYTWDRIGARLPVVAVLGLGVGVLVVIVTTAAIVRRIIQPLTSLGDAARRVGRGEDPGRLPETGPKELSQLARTFNRMSQQVSELLANRTILLAGVSHDLKTPLTRLQLAVGMLPEKVDPRLVGGICRDLTNMGVLLDRYLDLAKGLQSEEKEATDIEQFIAVLCEEHRRAGIRITCWGCDVPPVLDVGRTALRRIIDNLIENAVRYGGGKGVDVECRSTGGPVVISVLDRGEGIPAEHREAVFRPFYRLEQSRNKNTGGSGLGLAICRQLAEANDWELTLHPRQGGGTEARLVLRREQK